MFKEISGRDLFIIEGERKILFGTMCSIGNRIFIWNNAYAFFIWKYKYTTIFMSMVGLFPVRNIFGIYL